jgi:hypothetical protein
MYVCRANRSQYSLNIEMKIFHVFVLDKQDFYTKSFNKLIPVTQFETIASLPEIKIQKLGPLS